MTTAKAKPANTMTITINPDDSGKPKRITIEATNVRDYDGHGRIIFEMDPKERNRLTRATWSECKCPDCHSGGALVWPASDVWYAEQARTKGEMTSNPFPETMTYAHYLTDEQAASIGIER